VSAVWPGVALQWHCFGDTNARVGRRRLVWWHRCHRENLVVLDVDAAEVYRKWPIEPESPAKGDFVQNNKLAAEK